MKFVAWWSDGNDRHELTNTLFGDDYVEARNMDEAIKIAMDMYVKEEFHEDVEIRDWWEDETELYFDECAAHEGHPYCEEEYGSEECMDCEGNYWIITITKAGDDNG